MVDGLGSVHSLAEASHGNQGKTAAWGWPLGLEETTFLAPNQFRMDWGLCLCGYLFVCLFVLFCFLTTCYNQISSLALRQ